MQTTPRTLLTLALALASLGQAGHAANTEVAAIVGEATLVIGGARLWAEDGSVRAVNRGTPVRVGDRLETAAGGHVHLRFVDGGRLSIRPASRLQVESYSHTPDQPQQGAIKFRLDEGVARSITGAWGEAARERFRLNTPVAAIGVKGTDFIVSADANSTAATVYSGAIALTPLASGCGSSVGPCINGHERMLSADMAGHMLELTRNQVAPTLVAVAQPVLSRVVHSAEPASSGAGAGVSLVAAARPAESSAPEAPSIKVLGTENTGAHVIATYVPPAVTPPAPQPPEVTPPAPPAPAPAPLEPPIVIAPPPPPQVTDLTWMRYAWTPKSGDDDFSKTADQALHAGLEKIASTLSYTLYRNPVDAASTSAAWAAQIAAQPVVDFRLAHAGATLSPGDYLPAQNVNVLHGALRVDFARNLFATQLNLHNPSMGAQQIQASGNVTANGAFQATASNATLAGGLSGQLKDAGYTFEKPTAAGLLTGITLWGR